MVLRTWNAAGLSISSCCDPLRRVSRQRVISGQAQFQKNKLPIALTGERARSDGLFETG